VAVAFGNSTQQPGWDICRRPAGGWPRKAPGALSPPALNPVRPNHIRPGNPAGEIARQVPKGLVTRPAVQQGPSGCSDRGAIGTSSGRVCSPQGTQAG